MTEQRLPIVKAKKRRAAKHPAASATIASRIGSSKRWRKNVKITLPSAPWKQ